MGFRAGLKNAGKWSRVNKFLQDHPDFRTTVNANSGVHASLAAMDVILLDEATTAGVAGSFSNRLATNGLPVPLRVWQGRLVYSSRAGFDKKDKAKPTPNQEAFRNRAKELRDHVDYMFREFSMLDDAWSEPRAHGPNPGGNVGDGGTP